MTDLRGSAAHVFVDPVDFARADIVPLAPDTEHHLRRVLRLRDGEAVTVSDGAGRWHAATVFGAGDSVRLERSGDVRTAERDDPLTLVSAIPKGDRLDWMVQKATELGVDRVQLLHAERSVVRWKPDRFERQTERLQRISDEAARQSRRVWRVEILPPVPVDELLAADLLAAELSAGGASPAGVVMAEPGGRKIRATDRVLVIGPEGGWTTTELEMGCEHVTLGRNILRTETAALAAITLCVAARRDLLA